jgi:micrococcal nuclease
MKKYFLILVLFAGVSIASAQSFLVKEVVKVYDGDTITVNLNCKLELFCNKISIRIFGIDTPEIRGSGPKEKELAYQAKEVTKNFVEGSSKIYLTECSRGKYFRLICKVHNGKTYLSKTLLDKNLAVEYYGGTKNHNWEK